MAWGLKILTIEGPHRKIPPQQGCQHEPPRARPRGTWRHPLAGIPRHRRPWSPRSSQRAVAVALPFPPHAPPPPHTPQPHRPRPPAKSPSAAELPGRNAPTTSRDPRSGTQLSSPLQAPRAALHLDHSVLRASALHIVSVLFFFFFVIPPSTSAAATTTASAPFPPSSRVSPGSQSARHLLFAVEPRDRAHMPSPWPTRGTRSSTRC